MKKLSKLEEDKAEMAFKMMDKWVQMCVYCVLCVVMCRNNDGYITKKEMLSSTTKLTRSQVGREYIVT